MDLTYEKIKKINNNLYIFKKKFLNIKKIMLFLISSIKSNESLENFIHKNEKVFEIKNQLLNYTKNNLTTELIAKGIIERIQS